MSQKYELQRSVHPGKWVCTDIVNKIVVVFDEHKFNDTQEITFIDGEPQDVMKIARMLREMADWLGENYYNIIF
jgi:hypothetical protein